MVYLSFVKIVVLFYNFLWQITDCFVLWIFSEIKERIKKTKDEKKAKKAEVTAKTQKAGKGNISKGAAPKGPKLGGGGGKRWKAYYLLHFSSVKESLKTLLRVLSVLVFRQSSMRDRFYVRLLSGISSLL